MYTENTYLAHKICDYEDCSAEDKSTIGNNFFLPKVSQFKDTLSR